ncbi:hypothetical protein Pfo_031002 [Paulownia fortunei]|nr:hypothetical protein Pfo_031002 [Paulownia fortunei]
MLLLLVSYQTQRQATRIIDDFPQKNHQFDYQIGMYHGSVGADGSPYAPFSVGDLLSKNYDYWALGHIHKRQTLNQRPFVGYSGNLQGLNLTETGPKGIIWLVMRLVVCAYIVDVAPVVWHEVTFNDVVDELDLIQRAQKLCDDEVGFWTINISQKNHPEFTSRIASGLALEGLRANMAPNVWIVRLNLIDDYESAQISDTIDQQFWEESLVQLIKKQSNNIYDPRDGSRYGGDLVVETADGDFCIARFGRTQSTLTITRLADQHELANPEEWLSNNLSPEQDLAQIKQISAFDLQKLLLNLGAVGSTKWLEAAINFDKQADNLFAQRSSGKRHLIKRSVHTN